MTSVVTTPLQKARVNLAALTTSWIPASKDKIARAQKLVQAEETLQGVNVQRGYVDGTTGQLTEKGKRVASEDIHRMTNLRVYEKLTNTYVFRYDNLDRFFLDQYNECKIDLETMSPNTYKQDLENQKVFFLTNTNILNIREAGDVQGELMKDRLLFRYVSEGDFKTHYFFTGFAGLFHHLRKRTEEQAITAMLSTTLSLSSFGRRKMSKRMSKRMSKKYTERKSPPFPAKEFPDKRKKGNDGTYYTSVSDKNGVYRWQHTKLRKNIR